MADERERVLLLGGPFHFRTCWVTTGAHVWYFPLPDERPIRAYEFESWDTTPIDIDLKVAEYVRSGMIGDKNEIHGAIFKHWRTR